LLGSGNDQRQPGDPEVDRSTAFAGYSKTQIAKWNGIALSSVSPLVERLENELREIAGEPPDEPAA
jgi:hypothetical protein